MNEWRNFKEGTWCNEINVSDFIKNNYVAYTGNENFLAGPTEKTKRVLKIYEDMCSLSERTSFTILDELN